ncbi:T9SS type A sorting domain-containing protein [Segetibacter sp. 3557_3]|uniref:T9SS type A sorting domain-containing protein n=1 Tax=Segetibacter sp. 3557_3 TaxID=2547429 RepID=UPI0010589EA5|nr:T9SS type A sorting domain-containing protein [Segetibacter sp. 3557_3]TDH27020.1 T9SS type A sorting domain-containing protein [Segetibacter sp. 3557_3]
MRKKLFLAAFLSAILFVGQLKAQVCEWRIVNPTYSTADPDGAGPARGSATFTIQLHTVSGTINNVNTISMGWSYQSAFAMIPGNPGCNVVNNPANVSVSPAFASAGFAFTTVNQCGTFTQTAGGQTFDRRTVGTMDGTGINLTTGWIDVFTVTLWTLGTTAPEGGYVIINSGAGGTPGPFPTYAVANVNANEFVVNSLSYNNPVPLGSGSLPVTLAKFEATCSSNFAVVSWQTLSEENSDHFEIERSTNGINWQLIASRPAAGSSATARQYEYVDPSPIAPGYYRLKQIDKDGKFSYSGVAKTTCTSKSPLLVLYPVPATDVVNITLTIEQGSRVSFKILDVTGKVYSSSSRDLVKGENQVQLNVSRFSSGQYILSVQDGEKVYTEKLLIK